MSLTALELYERLGTAGEPSILDVRNADEFARWRIEGRRAPDILNVPYFEFVELEEESVRRVRAWRSGRPRDLVVVCAKGDSSAFVADILRAHGIAAGNVEGGMVAWGREAVFRPLRFAGSGAVRVWQALRFGRGCLSYVLAAGTDAIVVDPHRAIDAYRAFLERQGLALRAVAETHLHADHVSGATALARGAAVPRYANPADFEGARSAVEPVEDGARIRAGRLEVWPALALHTPGHTPGSTSFLVDGALLLTGDTVFAEGVGRPDLGGQTAAWARALHRTLRGRLATLAADVTVAPAHSGGPDEVGPEGTVVGRLGDVLQASPAAQIDEEVFVRQAEAGSGTAPAEYARIRTINLGRAEAAEEELVELELGKNQCAMSRR